MLLYKLCDKKNWQALSFVLLWKNDGIDGTNFIQHIKRQEFAAANV